MPWVEDEDDDEDDDDVVIDFSELFGDDSVIDAGVTSGADPTSWDPIDIDGDQ